MLVLGCALHAFASQPAAGEEYRVYEAALAQLDSPPNPKLHVAIYDRTLNGNCDRPTENPVLAKGCTFLWIKPQTPDDVEQMLRLRWRHFPKAAWKTFVRQNASSEHLHEPLVTPWPHRLMGGEAPRAAAASASGHAGKVDAELWRRPDMAIFLSRVGFNRKQTEAILYVLVFSYVDGPAVSGDYLLFRAQQRAGEEKSWALAGRVNYFSGAKDSSATMHLPSEAQPARTVPHLRLAAERK